MKHLLPSAVTIDSRKFGYVFHVQQVTYVRENLATASVRRLARVERNVYIAIFTSYRSLYITMVFGIPVKLFVSLQLTLPTNLPMFLLLFVTQPTLYF